MHDTPLYRLERLERTVALLVDRLDSRLDDIRDDRSHESGPPPDETQSSPDLDPAPVFLIRDAATNAGVHSPEETIGKPSIRPDVIASGLVSLSTAHTLLHLYACSQSCIFFCCLTLSGFISIMAAGSGSRRMHLQRHFY